MSFANEYLAVQSALWKYAPELNTGYKTLFVGSSTSGSSTSGPGTAPTGAYSTLAAALDSLQSGDANKGVKIYVMPGHTESISSSSIMTADIAGVRVIGVGDGRARPIFTWNTATSATWNVSGANFRIDNCRFDLTGIDAVAAGFTVSAADFQMYNCEMEFANSSGQATLGILTTSAASRMKVIGNHMFGTTDAGTATAIRVVGGSDAMITDNTIIGAFTTSLGGIEVNTTDASRIIINRNNIANMTASSTKAIVLTSSSTGFITNNRLAVLSGTAPITAAAAYVGGNYYVAAAGVTAGTLI